MSNKLTRYRAPESKMSPDERYRLVMAGKLVPDTTLQDIADVWNRYERVQKHMTRQVAGELAALLDALVDDDWVGDRELGEPDYDKHYALMRQWSAVITREEARILLDASLVFVTEGEPT